MLVLSRKVGQQVVITASNGETIIVTALDQTRAGQITIGFDAPISVDICREEILEKPQTTEGAPSE